MKNIFKVMGLALMACSLMVACGNDNNEEPNDTTPVTPPAPTSSVTIVWDGVEQNLGFKDAYQSSSNPNLFWFEGAKGMNGQDLEFPAFYMPFYQGSDGNFLPAFLFTFTDNQNNEYDGNDLFPTEVFNEGGLTITEGEETYVIGDYQLYTHRYTAMPEVTFDATALTLSINVPVVMYDYEAYANSQSVVQKDLNATFVNYPFEAAK